MNCWHEYHPAYAAGLVALSILGAAAAYAAFITMTNGLLDPKLGMPVFITGITPGVYAWVRWSDVSSLED